MAIEAHNEIIIRGPGRQVKYPFATMELGDTFYVYPKNGKNQFGVVYSVRRYWERKLPGRKFDVHAVSVGLRVQRVE